MNCPRCDTERPTVEHPNGGRYCPICELGLEECEAEELECATCGEPIDPEDVRGCDPTLPVVCSERCVEGYEDDESADGGRAA